jgi:hypothetical protein
MARLYSDLRDGSGRRYYYALTSAPGGIQPAQTTLTITGYAPTIFEQVSVSRTPTPATITINGRALSSDVFISPAAAALSTVGQIPGEYRTLIVTNTITPDYTEPQDLTPTVLFINTVSPTPAQITLTYPQPNVTQGGNIGFVSPTTGTVTLQGRTPTLIFHGIELGALTVQGLVPSLYTELTIEVGLGIVTINGQQVTRNTPFQWIDVDAPPGLIWTTTTGVAA